MITDPLEALKAANNEIVIELLKEQIQRRDVEIIRLTTRLGEAEPLVGALYATLNEFWSGWGQTEADKQLEERVQKCLDKEVSHDS